VTTERFAGQADVDLVEAARRGDREAFAELIIRHRRTALAVTARLMGSDDLASDAVQEATLLAMTGLDRLLWPERFGAWLCGIALNVARRWLRELRSISLTPGLAVADVAPGPDEQVEAAEFAAAVRRAIAGLADGQRDAVLLFYLQGLTHREVAAELAISVGAVKARLHQARAALTPKLAPLVDTKETPPMPNTGQRQWIEVAVSEVRREDGDDPTRRRHVIVLRERNGDRELPIWVGPFEATAVALSLEAAAMPRPMTYQFTSYLVNATGSRVAEVRITELTEGIFYATVVIDGPAGAGEVDARPSYAVNLALVTGSPIRVDPQLLEDPRAAGLTEWQDYPLATADIADEVRMQFERDLTGAQSRTTQGDVANTAQTSR
jgi:RNA polymerase sigma factor (sigma-70 family)